MTKKKLNAGTAGSIARLFINSKLTPLLMIAFLAIGIYGAFLTPREEEPQINVPMADIFVHYPGATPEQVEARISKPMEKIFSDIPGVQYVYSTSSPEQAVVSVRFYVGQDIERSLVRLYNEMMKHADQFPPGASAPLVKTRSIDDVPVLGLTLWSTNYSGYQLRRIAANLKDEVKQVTDVSSTHIIGGQTREISVIPDNGKMAAYQISTALIASRIQQANQQGTAGSFNQNDTCYTVRTGDFLKTADDVSHLILRLYQGHPVYLSDVADVTDGPAEPTQYVAFGYGQMSPGKTKFQGSYPAVTLSVAKRKGADAMRVSEHILKKVNQIKNELLPRDVHLEITRNYGETASHKVAELLSHLLGAILSVTLVVMLAMGWRGGLVVFLSVPITFALTMFSYYCLGYTLNRITLFALVFVTGIVVDDSIIIAENMHRHFKIGKLPPLQSALKAIDEVGNPTILATFTVIAAVLPMAFVSGLMGPYMSPMPIGAAIAMIFSLLIALTITPYLAFRLLKHRDKKHPEQIGVSPERAFIYRIYAAIMNPLLTSSRKRVLFLSAILLLLLGSFSLIYFKQVPVKMLPFDNKNEFQVIVDMPEGTSLERTAAVTRKLAAFISRQDEVVNYQTYVGTASPINFNGLVRHYDLRRGANVADIQVNLTDKKDRSVQSHAIAKNMRAGLQKIGEKYNANVKVVEVPPGPPVLSTLVAEVYGPDYNIQRSLARQVKKLFARTPGIVDTDWQMEDDQPEYTFHILKDKAALLGLSSLRIKDALQTALQGKIVARIYPPHEESEIPVTIRFSQKSRSGIVPLKMVQLLSSTGRQVTLADVVTIQKDVRAKSIYRKNQRRVVYVLADIAGKLESPVYSILDLSDSIQHLSVPAGYHLTESYTHQPASTADYTIKWDGEWQITYEVFRDLGKAFAVVLIIIYLLIVGWFQDFKVPFVMMIAIPLSLIGILIGHWIPGAFFTATSMIGMIALAGIMVRNSILLIDFINIRLKDGIPLKTAIIEAGAVRTTPILLTAGTVVIGAVVILFDPIFQGLAISLMGGTIASTVLTLVIVPLIYFMTEKKKYPDKATESHPGKISNLPSENEN